MVYESWLIGYDSRELFATHYAIEFWFGYFSHHSFTHSTHSTQPLNSLAHEDPRITILAASMIGGSSNGPVVIRAPLPLFTFARQAPREPSKTTKVHHQLAQVACGDGHAFLAELRGLVGGGRWLTPSACEHHVQQRTRAGSSILRGAGGTSTYLGEMMPLELMTRCQGTLVLLKREETSEGRCLRQTPT